MGMMAYVFTAVLLIVLLIVGMLERYYSLTPISELRRQARGGDGRASLLHEVARNLNYARFYLNLAALIVFAALISYLAARLSTLELVAATLLVAFLWVVAVSQASRIAPLAVKIAPSFALFIVALRPYAAIVKKMVGFIIPTKERNYIYEKDDLIALIEKQKTVSSNRIDKVELELALHALTFGEKLVRDHMTPRKVVRFVASDEPVSPILMDELHKTGFSRFPVYMDDIDNVVGTLYLKSLVERKMSGKVFSAMSTDVYDVAETENLEAVLQKFLKTKHHLFVVKNEFREVVGIITIEDIIEQILGRKIVDEFDLHDDMREFASETAEKENIQDK